MAADIERLGKEMAEKYPEIAGMLYKVALFARNSGVPEELATAVPTSPKLELDLEIKWLKQAEQLADLFANELGQSRDQYIESLPKFEVQPEGYRGRFDSPMIVQVPQGNLTLVRMLEIQGVTNYLSYPRELKDWQRDSQKFTTPKRPYATWLHDGSRNLNKAPRDVRKALSADERAGTVVDGLAILAQNPDILKNHYLDLPGYQYESDDVPYLVVWCSGPGLDYYWDDSADPRCGSVVAGRKIVTK